MKDKKNNIFTAANELAFQKYILKNFPSAIKLVYPPETTVKKTVNEEAGQMNTDPQSYGAVAALLMQNGP